MHVVGYCSAGSNPSQVVRQRNGKPRSPHADYSNVDVLLSRESAVLLMRCYPGRSLADAIHLAMMTAIECFARDILYIITRPILFNTPANKQKIKAALLKAAELMPSMVELTIKGKGFPVQDVSRPLLEYITDESSVDGFETQLGGVSIQYILYGKKSATSCQVRAFMNLGGCNWYWCNAF